jgi:hypothetical protein
MKRIIIRLSDGYNGHSCAFFADPIERDGELVKLQCAEPGRGHLVAWKRVTDVEKAKQ